MLPAEPTEAMRQAYTVLSTEDDAPMGIGEASRWALLADESDPVAWATQLLALSRALQDG